jgi:hypothetical protein
VQTQGGSQIPSDVCRLDDLVLAYGIDSAVRDRLLLDESRSRRWSATWCFDGDEVAWPVRDVSAVPLLFSEPVRRFTWRARQRHRPGLQYMVSTGRHHGFESLEEQRLLLALDFLTVGEVLPQPFRLLFAHVGGRGEHTPDFLAVMPDGGLLDVRPRRLVHQAEEVKFAAAAETAVACGWRYTVVAGWRQHVQSVLHQLSAQRRTLQDPLFLQEQLAAVPGLAAAVTFGELVNGTSLPAVARAHVLHLLWHRRLAIDLGRPLGDGSLVWNSRAGAGA